MLLRDLILVSPVIGFISKSHTVSCDMDSECSSGMFIHVRFNNAIEVRKVRTRGY